MFLQRGAVGQVGIEVMDPGEKRSGGPGSGAVRSSQLIADVGHLVGRPFVEVDHLGTVSRHGNLEIVEVETPIQAEPRVHDERSDKSGGIVAVFLEGLRQCGRFGPQGVDAVVVNPVTQRATRRSGSWRARAGSKGPWPTRRRTGRLRPPRRRWSGSGPGDIRNSRNGPAGRCRSSPAARCIRRPHRFR